MSLNFTVMLTFIFAVVCSIAAGLCNSGLFVEAENMSQLDIQTIPSPTIVANIDSAIWTALMGGIFSVIGVFAGYIITAKVTANLRKDAYNLSVIRGICSIICELEENQEQIKIGEQVNQTAWRALRKEPWYLSSKVGQELRQEIFDVYHLFQEYNNGLNIIRQAKPTEISGFLASFSEKSLIDKKVQTLKEHLLIKVEKMQPN